jgi:hypothetical protein
MKSNFRIVYLKNDESRKYNDDKMKVSSNIIPHETVKGKTL